MRLGTAARHGLVTLSVIAAARASGVRLGPLLDADASRNVGAVLRGFAHPDVSGEFLSRIAGLALDSLLIGVLATALAAVLGVVSAAICIRIPTLEEPDDPPVRRALGAAVRLATR